MWILYKTYHKDIPTHSWHYILHEDELHIDKSHLEDDYIQSFDNYEDAKSEMIKADSQCTCGKNFDNKEIR